MASHSACPTSINGTPKHSEGTPCTCWRDPKVLDDSHYVVIPSETKGQYRMIVEAPHSSEKFQNKEYEIPRSTERRRSRRRDSGQPFTSLDRKGTVRRNNRSVKQGKQWKTSDPERSVLRYTTG